MNPVESNHPDEITLEAYADSQISSNAMPEVSTHLASCAACAAYVERVRALNDSLAGLPQQAIIVPPLDVLVLQRARETKHRSVLRWQVVLPALAAASVFFVAGLLTGQRSATKVEVGQAHEQTVPPSQAMFEVQRTGSSYVAAIARLGAISGQGTGVSDAIAREVTASTLYGAASEAARVLDKSAEGHHLAELARTVRDQSALKRSDEL